MKNSFFSLEDLEVSLGSIFDTLRIYRFDDKRCPVKEIPVSLVSTSPENFISDIKSDSNTVRLPIVSLVRGGWGRDPTRVKNKDNSSSYINQEFTQSEPVPINMNFTVSILALYKEDINQIEQSLVQFINPQTYQFINDPLTQEAVSLEILWSGQWNETYPPVTQEGTVETILQASTTFTVKGYLWMSDLDYQRTPPIKKINLRLLAGNPATTQWRQEFRGMPCATKALNASFLEETEGFQKLWGFNMGLVEQIYLSASGDIFGVPLSSFAPNLELTWNTASPGKDCEQECGYEITSDCPIFSGIPIYEWSRDKYSLTFTVPPMSGNSVFDIVLVNKNGCCVVSESVRRIELENPFNVDDELFNTWLEYQYPYVNGFRVFGMTKNSNCSAL